MAIHEVQGPDGQIHQIDAPEGATPDQVLAFAQASIPQPQADVPPPPSNAQPVGKWDSFVQGAQDPINGIAQGMLHAAQSLPANMQPDGLKGADQFLDNKLQSDNQNYEAGRTAAGRDGIDWMRIAGNAASTGPAMMALPAGSVGIAGKIAEGLGAGAVGGAVQPVDNSDGNYLSNKAEQIGVSSGLGGMLGPVASGISSVISPKVSPEVKTLLDEGVTPTPGQIAGGAWARAEDKATSIPLLGGLIKKAQARSLDQFNTAALGRALAPISEDAPDTIGRSGIQTVKNTLSDAYDSVIPNLSFKADPTFKSSLSDLRDLASGLPDQQANQFNKIIDTQVTGKLSKSGMMDGQTYKGAQSEVANAAKGYASDSSYDNRQLGAALMQANSLMKQGLQRSNPVYADQLQSIDNGYANYAILRNASSRLGAHADDELGKFTPSQLQSAVRSADKSAGKGNFATGNARMQDLSDAGVSVLSQKYPDSGTGGRELLAGLLFGEGGATLAGHAVLPMATAGALSLPYTPMGQKLAAALLTQRPNVAAPIGNAVSKSAKYIAGGIAPGMLPGSQAVSQ